MKRIQRKRVKGFKLSDLSDNYVYVGRGSKWGNPLKLTGDMIYIDAGYRRKLLDKWVYWGRGNDIDDLLHLYELIVTGTQFVNEDLQYWADKFKQNDLNELKGKDLACFCPLDQKCHADVLLKLISEL